MAKTPPLENEGWSQASNKSSLNASPPSPRLASPSRSLLSRGMDDC